MLKRPKLIGFGLDAPRRAVSRPPKVKLWRSLAKAISWRIVGTIDTLILSYLLITYLGPLVGLQQSKMGALEAAGLIAITEVATKMTLYFLHERGWSRLRWGVSVINGKRAESYQRTSAKTATWRMIGSVDTMVLGWLYTGSIATAVSIGGTEVFTKLILYFLHERLWARLPIGFERNAA